MLTATYDEFKEAGYKEVWGIGRKEILSRYCKSERLLLTKVVDIDTALYSKERPEGYVIDIEDENERRYVAYKLGCRGFVRFIDDSYDALISYFIEREKTYWERAREIGRRKRRESGGFIGGCVPYGYYRANKKIYVDEYESFVVKFCFYRYSQNCGYGGIAKELNLRGFKNRKGNPFKAGSIESIIKNKRLYQGYFTYGDKEIKGEFRGILEDSEELLTKEWKERVFDQATEAKIAKYREMYHKSAPKEVKPYVIAEDHFDGRAKIREVKRGVKGSV